MRAADTVPAEVTTGGASTSFEWQATDPECEGTVRVTRPDDLAELAVAEFRGANRVELAMSLVHTLPYVPEELLHLAARESPHHGIRLASLSALGELYASDGGPSRWDASVALTVERASSDVDRKVREAALSIRVRAEPRGTPRGRQAPPLRLAFPTFAHATVEQIVDGFLVTCSVVQRGHTAFGGGADLVELAAREVDATLVYIVSPVTRVGAVYFAGPNAFQLAFVTQEGVSYFPATLARAAIDESRRPEARVFGLHALALAEATQILPRERVDPRNEAAFACARRDPDPRVRIAANQMTFFIEGA